MSQLLVNPLFNDLPMEFDGIRREKASQLDLLKAHFERGGSLTVAEALSLYGVYALSQRCGDLYKQGYPVTSDWETTLSGKHVMRYSKLKVAYG